MNKEEKVTVTLTRQQWLNAIKILRMRPNVWSPNGIPTKIENQLKGEK
tara:strand:- start:152 stop:295 length:144 start_codon:yes stop_codon:yes gene_type:complete